MKNKKINFWIAMKPTGFFLEDWSFDELELIIESSDSGGPENDIRIRRALSVTTNIEFYRYKVNFKLHQ